MRNRTQSLQEQGAGAAGAATKQTRAVTDACSSATPLTGAVCAHACPATASTPAVAGNHVRFSPNRRSPKRRKQPIEAGILVGAVQQLSRALLQGLLIPCILVGQNVAEWVALPHYFYHSVSGHARRRGRRTHGEARPPPPRSAPRCCCAESLSHKLIWTCRVFRRKGCVGMVRRDARSSNWGFLQGERP